MRALLGFIVPASPSVTLKSDMAKWVRDNGEISYKSTFNALRNKYNDPNKAIEEWIKYYPDQMPYTISETDSNVVANVRAVDGATAWVDSNKQLLAKYPEAASFLMPQAGEFDFEAYKLLTKSGLRSNKTVTDFVREVSSAKDRQIYYSKRNEFEEQMSYTTDTNLKRQLRDEWQSWADEFKGARPLLQDQLGKFSENAIQRTRALDDLRNMLNDSEVKTQPKLRSILNQMVTAYDDYVNQRDLDTGVTFGNKQDYKNQLKENTKSSLESLAQSDPNALAAYNSLFAPLFN
jgi:hypothetical protein